MVEQDGWETVYSTPRPRRALGRIDVSSMAIVDGALLMYNRWKTKEVFCNLEEYLAIGGKGERMRLMTPDHGDLFLVPDVYIPRTQVWGIIG